MNLRDTYNKIAKDWVADHADDDWWVEGTNKFISFLKPDASVLDVGCGAGIKSKYLHDKGLTATGFDFAENFIDAAKKNAPECTFRVLDLYDAGQIAESYDGIFMQAVLLHVPRAKAQDVVHSLAEKLNPDGYFYIAVKEKKPGREDEETRIENDYGYEYERFFSYYDISEIKTYLQNAGLEIIHEDIHPSGRTKWVQIIGQKVL